MELTFGSYNFEFGGIDDGNDERLRRQLALLAEVQADAWAFQECSNWRAARTRTVGLVERELGMRGFFARSNRGPGMDLAVFVRESAGIRVVEPRHEERPVPYWHGVAHVITEVDGFGPLRLVSAHLAPASPTQRLIEAESFALIAEPPQPLIAGGDWNAFTPGTPEPDTGGIHPGKVRRKHDTRAAEALEEYMTDVAAYLGITTPTVGHRRSDRLAYQPDRLYTTLPDESITGLTVIHEDDPEADHRPVVGTFTVGSQRDYEGIPA
jgi:endonuclease/exonuclease/phosphatase family metal-dependent hydrolase